MRLENGVVRTPDGFKEAYRKFVEGGWHGLQLPAEWGGQGLPWTVATAVWEMWNSANLAFCLCPILTQAGVELLLRHGTEAQRARYLAKLVSGEWTGTMCLTEPQAGCDVGALKTRAVREGDHYRIYGTKIFITYGEHDYTDNTIHMVLARTPGRAGRHARHLAVPDPEVPGRRRRLARAAQRSPLRLARAQARHSREPDLRDVVRRREGAIGYLVGEEQGGMPAMFTMMNNARLSVGLEGLAIAERAYQGALAYARERVQGRRRERRRRAPARIIEHPDVRRMLVTMKTQIEAMRALAYRGGRARPLAARARRAPAGRRPRAGSSC